MDGRTHRRVGAVVGVTATVVARRIEQKPLRLAELIGGGVGGVLGGSMPDILEPATSSHHRRFAHSITASGGLGYAAGQKLLHVRALIDAKADEWYALSKASSNWLEQFFYYLGALLADFVGGAIPGFIAGYLSHVALDSTTPRGVPIVGFA